MVHLNLIHFIFKANPFNDSLPSNSSVFVSELSLGTLQNRRLRLRLEHTRCSGGCSSSGLCPGSLGRAPAGGGLAGTKTTVTDFFVKVGIGAF